MLCLSHRQLPTVSLTGAEPATRTSPDEGPFLACFFLSGGGAGSAPRVWMRGRNMHARARVCTFHLTSWQFRPWSEKLR